MPRRLLTNRFKCDSFQHFEGYEPRENTSRPISRVLSTRFPVVDGHSSGACVATSFAQPTRATGRKKPRCRKASCRPYSVLLRVGFAWPSPVAKAAVRFYRTFSPLPCVCPEASARRFVSVALSLGLPPPGVTRHPNPVEPGLSSPAVLSNLAKAAIQPTGGGGVRRDRRLRQSNTCILVNAHHLLA